MLLCFCILPHLLLVLDCMKSHFIFLLSSVSSPVEFSLPNPHCSEQHSCFYPYFLTHSLVCLGPTPPPACRPGRCQSMATTQKKKVPNIQDLLTRGKRLSLSAWEWWALPSCEWPSFADDRAAWYSEQKLTDAVASEKLLKMDAKRREYDVVVIGEESHLAYNRVGLTSFFQHRKAENLYLNPREWVCGKT